MRYWLHALALLVGLFGLMELAARLCLGVQPVTRFDPDYDRIYAPGQPMVQSTEGFSRGRINALGHLDAPMPDSLPADGVLVIGDSYTEGAQVAADQRFTSVAGARLHRRLYNVGHPGWSPLNAIAFLARELPRFQPATVIVQVSGNDLKDLVSADEPHLVRGPDGALAVAMPKRAKGGLGRTITRAREAVSRSAFAGDVIGGLLTLTKRKSDDAVAGGAACAKPDALALAGIDWTVGHLASAHRDLRLLYLPSLDYHAGCTDRCTVARDAFASAAAAHGLRFIDVTGAICRRFAQTRQPLNGFANSIAGTGHFNAEGHQVIADELVRNLAVHLSGP